MIIIVVETLAFNPWNLYHQVVLVDVVVVVVVVVVAVVSVCSTFLGRPL